MPEITSREARTAKDLVNVATGHGSLIALAARLPAEILARIREAHEDRTADMCCAAHCEGLSCCIDILLLNPADYVPDRVAEAQALLFRYRQQTGLGGSPG